jgi:CHRD domain
MRLRRAWTNVLAVSAAVWPLMSTPALAESITLVAEITGAAQVPPNPSKGSGTVTGAYDTVTRVLTWKGTYSGLTGQPMAAHFHGPADARMNAPVVVNFEKLASPFEGTATLTEAQAADLLAGRWYANFHTPSYPGGELRGQVVRAKDK